MTRFRAALATVGAAALLATGTTGTLGTSQALAAPAASQSLTSVRPPGTRVHGIDVDAATIPQLQRYMKAHRLSSVDLVRFYLARIRVLNPKLHAVIRVSSTAVADARAADRARARGDRRPLLGIPVLVKDNINTTGMPTTAGSLALAGNAPPDAFIVKRLKAAGALILGKANLSEWANFRGYQSSSGWSAVGGQTRNPYVLDRNPCGSSSGSGVAAAADLATVAIGTETDGSIVCPAGQTGVVGVKPTLGLASRDGIVPISAQQDTAGPMTRNVTDAAVVLGAMTGVDPRDPATAAQKGHVYRDYTRFLGSRFLKGARIGVWRSGIFGGSPETDAVMERTITRLRALGATVVDPTDIPIEPAYDPEYTALLYEFKHDINAYLRRFAGRGYSKTLVDLIAFNRAHAAQELRWFGQEIFEESQATTSLSDPAYVKARSDATSIARRAIDDTLRKYRLDAVLAPTNSPAGTTDLVNGDNFILGSSSPAAIAGYANVTVPAGYSNGLPIGMSLIGGRWQEPRLVALAYAWERATHVRTPPRFLPTLGDSVGAATKTTTTARATATLVAAAHGSAR
jgi:amidase